MNDWDTYVNQNPEGTIFHTQSWKKVIEETYGFKPRYLSYRENDQIQGILPLFECQKKLISVPFATQGGILYNKKTAKEKLLKKAIDISKETGSDYLELREENPIDQKLKTKDYYYHMKLDLENVNYRRDLKRGINKAIEKGIEVRKGTVDEFYKIFCKNMRDLGTPVDNKQFFINIQKHLPDDHEILVATLKNIPISTLFLFRYKDTIKAEWQSTDKNYLYTHASDLIYDHAIKRSIEENKKVFDFGRSVEDEGTYSFKEKFGAQPVKMHYQYYVNKGNIPDLRKTNKKRQLFVKVWKHLPLAITNNLGPILRKRFP